MATWNGVTPRSVGELNPKPLSEKQGRLLTIKPVAVEDDRMILERDNRSADGVAACLLRSELATGPASDVAKDGFRALVTSDQERVLITLLR